MSEDESGEGSASSADEDPVDQDEDSQADLNASMQEMNVQQVRIICCISFLGQDPDGEVENPGKNIF